MRRRHGLVVITGIGYFVIGLVGLLTKPDITKFLETDPFTVIAVSLALILIGIGCMLYVYLQGGFSTLGAFDPNEMTVKYARQFERFRNEVNERLSHVSNLGIDENKVASIIEAKIDKISNETLFNQIKDKYEDKLKAELKSRSLEDELLNIKERIERDTMRISRNGNINLTIGFFTTFMAIFFLGYSLLGVSYDTESTQRFIFHFVPRFTLSLFIELFSFFFLRIYRKNLDDIKYLNNERTNIDFKLISLQVAMMQSDSATLTSVITEFSKTERNFILKKDESTVDIEKNKIDSMSSEKLLESLVHIINRK